MRNWIAMLIMLAAAGSYAEPASKMQLKLARGGTTDYRIVIGTGAIEPEKHAAHELAQFLKQVTGASFEIVSESEFGDGPAIFVGPGDRWQRMAPDLKIDNLGPEGFIIETRPPHIVLAGGRPRGTLYAVYTFLEDHVGCRWYSSKIHRIPSRPNLAVPPIHDRQIPILEYREPFNYDSFDADWAVRNKSNGNTMKLDAMRGGRIKYQGFVHTFYPLVPPDKYFVSHPEYFSEIDGKRTFERAQLCLTNPAVVDLVTQRVLEWLKELPDATIVSVSQNDWVGRCQCAECSALEADEGSPSGPLIRFVNQVAERVEKFYPEVAIDTLAYQYTRKPPRHAKPRRNVIVRLCSIECSFAHPLGTSQENRTFAEDIEGWSKICNRLYIWDYVTNFSHYIQPHPNLRVLKPNIEFFTSHGVKGIFEEGSYQSPGGELQELRSWVLAKLLWNPSADADLLIQEFIEGYYGPAAPHIRKYIDLIHRGVQRTNHFLNIGSPPTALFLSPGLVQKADRLFEQAERIASQTKDPALAQRVRVARLPVYYVMMNRENLWRQLDPKLRLSLSGTELRKRFFDIAAEENITYISESRKMEVFRDAMLLPVRHVPGPPPGCENRPKRSCLDIQDDEFRLTRLGQLTKIIPDSAASDGTTAWTGSDHRERAIQATLELPELRKHPNQQWRISAAVRIERAGSEGTAFSFGIFDRDENRNYSEGSVKVADINTDGYFTCEIGIIPIKGRRYVWVAPANNPASVKAIYVDRFVLAAMPAKGGSSK
jgi:hypothetical protein